MKEFGRSLIMFVVMSLLTGITYPYIITGLSQIEFRRQAQGSLVVSNDRVLGSSLIGQQFSGPAYFHGRPSALEKAYDASNSGGSNSGPANAKFLKEIESRVAKVREENGLPPESPVPADLVLASGSGLDPHISAAAAMLQVKRVARARRMSESGVRILVENQVEGPQFGFLGDDRVNVLLLNMALDELHLKGSIPEAQRAQGGRDKCLPRKNS